MGMGTDDFLQSGKDLELFRPTTYIGGSPRTVWIGGTDGTDVASVDLVTTDGDHVSATVAAGTLCPRDRSSGPPSTASSPRRVTRDADGNVIEEHELKPCSDPVDCEVR